MRFIATFQVNYRNILLEVKDVTSSLDKFDSFLYIGNLLRQMQSNTRDTPTDDFGGNLNEIHGQFSAKFQEYPFEANDVKLSLEHCAYFWAFYMQ